MLRIPRAILLAVSLCPLAVGALEPQHFKIRIAKDLGDLCGVTADDPKVAAMSGNTALGAAVGTAGGAAGGYLYDRHEKSKEEAYEPGRRDARGC